MSEPRRYFVSPVEADLIRQFLALPDLDHVTLFGDEPLHIESKKAVAIYLSPQHINYIQQRLNDFRTEQPEDYLDQQRFFWHQAVARDLALRFKRNRFLIRSVR